MGPTFQHPSPMITRHPAWLICLIDNKPEARRIRAREASRLHSFRVSFLAVRCLLFAAAAVLLCCGPARADAASAETQQDSWQQEGVASYYGLAHQGRRTASGAIFDMNAMTAAHPWLPFGTRVRVTLRESGRAVVVVITDRLFSARRVIDLSMGAARELGIIQRGVASVTLAPE